MSKYKIDDEDLPLIIELVKTTQAKIVAKKWDINPVTIKLFLKRHGLTVAGIRYAHRLKVIKENAHLSALDIADILGCGTYVVYKIKLMMD